MANNRKTPIEINNQEFKEIGYRLIDEIADFTSNIENSPITKGETPSQLQKILGKASLPEDGASASELVSRTTKLIFDHSLFNGHPKFFGYITASASPIGALADLLAATVNPNVGAQILSPIATEIEKQTVSWLAEFIGVSPTYGGLLVSGGNMANFTGFLAARAEKASINFDENGIDNSVEKLVVYCSKTTHTWVEKAAILFGHGSKSVRWIQTDEDNKMDNDALDSAIENDIKEGYKPFMVVGTAGDVSTGTVDDLEAIAAICKKYDLWFHVDGAYGVPAAIVPEVKPTFKGLEDADSIALDPHKWLYTPLEAGCTLIKNPAHLTNAFSHHPAYYNFSSTEEEVYHNFHEHGLQNSRGFRSLKVWLTIQQVGKSGYIQMIGDDIKLAKLLFSLAENEPELEAVTHSLSITTLRYVPTAFANDEEYLNRLNEALLNKLQDGGEVFLSNAVVEGKYCLRACIVNFRTSSTDIEEVVQIIIREGADVHRTLQA
jgi:aromatic-L-amino-acid decarboxylase